MDTDLTSDNPRPRGVGLTFRQFLTHKATHGMVVTALMAGLLAGALCFLLVRPRNFTRENTIALIFGVGAALVGATLIGMVITELHVPTGH